MRKAIVLLLVLSLLGCTTTRVVVDVSKTGLSSAFSAGDEVAVRMLSGELVELGIVSITETHLLGRLASNEQISIMLDEISSVQESEFSAGKTAGATLLTIVVLMVAMAYLVSELIEDSGLKGE